MLTKTALSNSLVQFSVPLMIVFSYVYGRTIMKGSFLVTRSDSESVFQQQFGENHGDDGCYSIYLTAAQSFGSQGLLQEVCNDDTWACERCIITKITKVVVQNNFGMKLTTTANTVCIEDSDKLGEP